MSKEEVIPEGVNVLLFIGLPVIALAGALTAALYVPLAGLAPAVRASIPGWVDALAHAADPEPWPGGHAEAPG